MDDIKLSNFNSKSKDEVVFTEDRIALYLVEQEVLVEVFVKF